jgi:hypothetical protein
VIASGCDADRSPTLLPINGPTTEVVMIEMRLLPALVLVLFTWGNSAHAQDNASGTTSSKPAVNRKCDSWQRRVAAEEKSLADASDSIAKDKKARESCATKGACARYDQAIKSMEARRSRHETRLGKFRIDAEKVCKA